MASSEIGERSPGEGLSWIGQVRLLLARDLTIEVRSREILGLILLFSVLVVVLFTFALPREKGLARAVLPGVIWMVLLFTATLVLGRRASREGELGARDALVLSPLSPALDYLAQVLVNLLLVLLVGVIVTLLLLLFFNLSPEAGELGLIILSLGLGSLGFSAVGTLMASLLQRTGTREVLLPLLLYPLLSPILIGGVSATEGALAGGADVGTWLALMGAFDLLFLAAATLGHGVLVSE